jgi:hypothetical protein
MKQIIRLAVTLGLGTFTSLAQPQAGDQGGPPGRHHPPIPPVMAVLDADTDGTLSAAEIANASVALGTLDKNSDGKLTLDELRPPPPGGTNQFGHRPPPPGGTNQFGFRGGKHPVPPIIAALDTDKDGELSAAEIANASAALLTLDKNGDGVLTQDEIRPRGPGGPGGHAGPEGPGGPGGGEGPGGPGGPDGGPGQPPQQ